MSQKEILDNEVVMMNKSLHPIAMYGETLPYIRDYYDYNIVKRGDVVVLDMDVIVIILVRFSVVPLSNTV